MAEARRTNGGDAPPMAEKHGSQEQGGQSRAERVVVGMDDVSVFGAGCWCRSTAHKPCQQQGECFGVC